MDKLLQPEAETHLPKTLEQLEARENEAFDNGYKEALKEAKNGIHHKDGIYSLEQVEQFRKSIEQQALEDLSPKILEALKGLSWVYTLPKEAADLHRDLMHKISLLKYE